MEGLNELLHFITQLTGKVVDAIPQQFPALVHLTGARIANELHLFIPLTIISGILLAIGIFFFVFGEFRDGDYWYGWIGLILPSILMFIICGIGWMIDYVQLQNFTAEPAMFTIMNLIGK